MNWELEKHKVISALEIESSAERRQQLLDSVFSLERRDDMRITAPVDIYGRPVVCFRRMTQERFMELLRNGDDTPFANSNDTLCAVHEHKGADQDSLDSILKDYAKYIGCIDSNDTMTSISIDKLVSSDAFYRHRQWAYDSSKDFDSASIAAILQSPDITLGELRIILDGHIDERFLKFLHIKGMSPHFSPFLSHAVGGPTADIDLASFRFVYIESIFPEDDLIASPNRNNSEKEILTRTLRIKDIARVHTTQHSLRDVFKDTELPCGQDALLTGQYDRLNWQRCDTRDCYPDSLIEEYDELHSPNYRRIDNPKYLHSD